ncbi:MAG TPA: phosphoribosylformylglycinamidine synthase subunit PurS [Thermoanaerobaculia bacterium]|nr:phosphoribosylformylglycinamidine synthase subunit PurS [Thermoanaerobaculia bacterium]HUM29779.1 phosphoribosylformylglycinamidine synthase subunit PurS [Thermoanaerobaculia bacterium]HXK67079.1 phosphoribosylformylglycinamidine synthase subunit PurS [Thermoanaerobaculia bacterium]
MKFKVEVFLKDVVLDPQGKTIQKAIQSLGYDRVHGVRAGKVFMMEIDTANETEGLAIAEDLAQKLLANTVIETARVTPVP